MPADKRIKIRRGTAAEWATAETSAAQLADGEVAWVDNDLVKGDGTTKAASLPRAGSGTYATPALSRPGRVPAWLGDSFVVGSGSSAATTTSFVAMVPKILGYAQVSGDGILAGVAGEKSGDIRLRVDAVLAQRPEFVHLQCGANDAGSAITVTEFAANIQAIRAKCDAAGVPMTMGTVPPRAAAAGTTVRNLIRSYNLWLRTWAPRAGIPLADTFAALVDPATGYLAASMDSDGTHPNDAGHLAIANAVATMLNTRLPSLPWPVVTAGAGLIADPLMASNPGGFSLGSNTTASLVAAVGGDVPAGQWKRFTKTNGTGATVYQSTADVALTTGFTAGDKLLICFYLRGSTGPALNKVQIENQGLTVRNVLFEASPSATPGPIMKTITVQPGDTTLYLRFLGAVPAAGSITIDIGALDVFNLTTLGLSSVTF